MEESDKEVWDQLVQAERDVARLRAEVGRRKSRFGTVAAALALGSDSSGKQAALNYLAVFPGDIPLHVEAVFTLEMTVGRFEGLGRQVLASGVRAEIVPKVRQCVELHLPEVDSDGYLILAALLAALEDGATLKRVFEAALASSDPDIRESGRSISEHYGELLAEL
jgi:hypothetical protein